MPAPPKSAIPSSPGVKAQYVPPQLTCYGSLEAITRTTSSGTILDGGAQANKNLMMA